MQKVVFPLDIAEDIAAGLGGTIEGSPQDGYTFDLALDGPLSDRRVFLERLAESYADAMGGTETDAYIKLSFRSTWTAHSVGLAGLDLC